MVRWSIVHKCQTLIKGILNNIEVNCICEIVPQTIFRRGGAKLNHLADWWVGNHFKRRILNLTRDSMKDRGQMVNTTARVFVHVVFYNCPYALHM